MGFATRLLLGSERLTGATLDRLTHRCTIKYQATMRDIEL